MKFDLVVGIPSYNEADSISFVVRQVDLGIQKYFARKKSIILNIDNCSPDDTKQVFLNTKTKTPKKYISTPQGVHGKGRNLFNLFKFMKKSGAKIGITLDADLKSITPLWIKLLTGPILRGYDLVCPRYARHKYDATITNHICYPLFYGLLGKDLRQPIAGDFAFSGRLVKYWLSFKWSDSVKNFGIDIFMTTKTIMGGFQICQVNLKAKIHKPSIAKLKPMLTQVTETLFKNLIENSKQWTGLERVEKIKIFGSPKFKNLSQLKIDPQKIKKEAFKSYDKKVIKNYLSQENFLLVDKMFSQKKFDITPKFWAKVVYDFLLAFAQAKNKKEVIEALKPLYFARFFSFIQKTKNWSSARAEKEIQNQARIFWQERDYFINQF